MVDKRMVATLIGCILLGSAASAEAQTSKLSNGCPVEAKAPPAPPNLRPKAIKLKLRKYVAPDYPAFARRAHVQGQVYVQAHITEKGEVKNPQIVSGHPLLSSGVLAAVRRWRYEPPCLKGVRVATDYQILVNFDLKGGITVP